MSESYSEAAMEAKHAKQEKKRIPEELATLLDAYKDAVLAHAGYPIHETKQLEKKARKQLVKAWKKRANKCSNDCSRCND